MLDTKDLDHIDACVYSGNMDIAIWFIYGRLYPSPRQD